MLACRLYILSLIVFLCSCGINRTVNGYRQGKWVFNTEQVKRDVDKLKRSGVELPAEVVQKGYYYKGRFRKGNEVGTWKYFDQGKLVRKEKYHGPLADVTFYYPNGKVESSGQTMFARDKKYSHWFYTGQWNFFNEKGELIVTRNYDQGAIINEKYNDLATN